MPLREVEVLVLNVASEWQLTIVIAIIEIVAKARNCSTEECDKLRKYYSQQPMVFTRLTVFISEPYLGPGLDHMGLETRLGWYDGLCPINIWKQCLIQVSVGGGLLQ